MKRHGYDTFKWNDTEQELGLGGKGVDSYFGHEKTYQFETHCLECGHTEHRHCTPTSIRANQIFERAIVYDWCSGCYEPKARLIHYWIYKEHTVEVRRNVPD